MAKLVRLRPLDVERERCVCLECTNFLPPVLATSIANVRAGSLVGLEAGKTKAV